MIYKNKLRISIAKLAIGFETGTKENIYYLIFFIECNFTDAFSIRLIHSLFVYVDSLDSCLLPTICTSHTITQLPAATCVHRRFFINNFRRAAILKTTTTSSVKSRSFHLYIYLFLCINMELLAPTTWIFMKFRI